MLRKVILFALHQPLFLFMPVVLFIIGVTAFNTLPIEAFPDVTDVQVAVITLAPGFAAEESKSK
jgi:cobalt-zinc-cadmium resistance protein CzcA